MNPWNKIAAIFLILVFIVSCKKDPVTDSTDFEELPLGSSGFWNGSDGTGGFQSGNITFVNHYNSALQTWSGFAYTNHTDTITKTSSNPYSSITGNGAENSVKYGVYYFSGKPDTMFFKQPEVITDFSVTNTVYSYYSMKSGSQTCKKFGGDSGNDQDYFKLRMTFLNKDDTKVGYMDIFLADYRFTDNSKDYIANAWTRIDLSTFGYIKAVIFEMESSDSGTGGINNPAYVCIDNIRGQLESQ
jgi:hypothetical protein